MLLEKASHWIQIVSGLVLIAGVGLVVIEMQQNQVIATAQLRSDYWTSEIDRVAVGAGENPMVVFAKVCDKDQSLTVEDSFVLSNYLQMHLYSILRSYESARTLGNLDERWKRSAVSNMRVIFGTEHGKAWWRSSVGTLPPDLDGIAQRLLDDSYEHCTYPGATAILDVSE